MSEPQVPVHAACHCGAVHLTIAAAPDWVTDCSCSICRRYGVLWAYYSPNSVRVDGAPTEFYTWDDKEIEFHRCTTCGCVTHWVPVDRSIDRMGVNARLMPLAVLKAAQVDYLDGAAFGGFTH